ncbi:MAG: hypothetical protein V1763_03300 [Parcubacteria group bacterium]
MEPERNDNQKEFDKWINGLRRRLLRPLRALWYAIYVLATITILPEPLNPLIHLKLVDPTSAPWFELREKFPDQIDLALLIIFFFYVWLFFRHFHPLTQKAIKALDE